MSNPPTELTIPSRKYTWVLFSGVWLILSLIMSIQLAKDTAGSEYAIPWLNAFLLEFMYCLQWIALAPLTLRLARMFPLRGKSIATAIPVHLLMGFLTSAVTMAGRALLTWMILHRMETPLTFEYITDRMTQALDYGIMSYLLNILLSYSFEFYAKVREQELAAIRLEAELDRAQLTSLKMQLHPHFFFNTLNTIAMLIRKQENAGAVDMIARLSKFLRYTLENTNVQEVPLREELEVIDLYFDIQKIRFGDNLTIQRSIAPDAMDCSVPTLILQPLVENSLEHGIAKRQSGGVVELSAIKKDGSLLISIADNGPGMNGDPSASSHQGIGIRNTVSRLEKLYGTSSTFNVQSGPEGGTLVQLVIPFRTLEQSE